MLAVRSLRLAVLVVVVLAGVLAVPAGAFATTCSAVGSNLTVSLDAGAQVELRVDGGTFEIGFLSMPFGEAACTGAPAPTPTNIDQIDISSPAGATNEQIRINFSNGWWPGATPEGIGNNEIEITVDLQDGTFDQVGAYAPDTGVVVVAGSSGINLNQDGDGDDITMSGIEALSLYGGLGDDNISLLGDPTTGGDAITQQFGTVGGFSGADTLTATGGDDTLLGGAGNDTMFPLGGADLAYGQDGDDTIMMDATVDGDDDFQGGPDVDTVDYSDRSLSLTVNAETGHGGESGEDDDYLDIEVYRLGTAGDTFHGGLGPDEVYADEGNDIIDGFDSADLLYGEDGNDTINGNEMGDTLSGGDGTDTLNGNGEGDTIYGGADNDVINGGYDGDTINGDGGADTINGDAGNDTLNGGDDHSDSVNGGDGDDLLDGGNGDDVLTGGDGDDTFDQTSTSNGGDGMTPGLGFDTLTYEGDPDQLTIDATIGQSGTSGDIDYWVVDTFEQFVLGNNNDTFTGGSAAETVRGNDGNDTIDGADGDDKLYGGDNDDTIDGGNANDLIWPGLGVDIAEGSEGSDTITSEDFIDGNDEFTFANGTDTLSYQGRTNPLAIDLVGGLAGEGLEGDQLHGAPEIVIGGTVNDVVTGTAGSDTVYGMGGNDNIVGAGGPDYIYGGDGDDGNLDGGAGNDTIQGGAGNDNVVGGLNNDTIISETIADGDDDYDGGFGIDKLSYPRSTPVTVDVAGSAVTAAGESDELVDTIEIWMLGSGDDHFTGDGDVNETIYPGDGMDNIDAGDGSDIVVAEDAMDVNDDFDGGPGIDVIDYSARTVAVSVSDDGNDNDGQATENDGIQNFENYKGGEGADTITPTAGDEANVIEGGDGNDTINAGDGDDIVHGQIGDDTLTGGLGDDSLFGEEDNDTFLEGAVPNGADLFDGAQGTNTVSFVSRTTPVTVNLSVAGGVDFTSENDDELDIQKVLGTAYADTLTGSTDNDQLFGNGGNDKITGRAGNDILNGGLGKDTFYAGTGNDGGDTITGGADSDIVDFHLRTSAVFVTIGSGANDGASGEADNLAGDIETILGSPFGDTITGNSLANTLTGNGGADKLNGGSGADVLHGNAGNDTITGGPGKDKAYGDAGTDFLKLKDSLKDAVCNGGSGRDKANRDRTKDACTGVERFV